MGGDGLMRYTQRVLPTDENGHTPIACEDEDGNIVWVSVAPEHTHPECRANPDHPLVDRDGKELDSSKAMCDDCKVFFGV